MPSRQNLHAPHVMPALPALHHAQLLSPRVLQSVRELLPPSPQCAGGGLTARFALVITVPAGALAVVALFIVRPRKLVAGIWVPLQPRAELPGRTAALQLWCLPRHICIPPGCSGSTLELHRATSAGLAP
jgi:hypothetical protein